MLHWKTLVVIAVLLVVGWVVTMFILSAMATRRTFHHGRDSSMS